MGIRSEILKSFQTQYSSSAFSFPWQYALFEDVGRISSAFEIVAGTFEFGERNRFKMGVVDVRQNYKNTTMHKTICF